MSPLLLLTLFIATVLATLLAFEAGLRFGRWRSRQPDPEPLAPVHSLVASVLSLLAFVLGFTFGLASSHYDARNQSVFDEAVAISTAYRRSDFLSDPEGANMRRLLREYVDVRLRVGQSGNRDQALLQLMQLQNQMWAQAIDAGTHNRGLPFFGPLMESLTEVIDVHGQRVVDGFRSRIPFRVWLVLYGIMLVAVGAAGYHAGLAGARRSFAAFAYALAFSAVIAMIVGGDVPSAEQFQTSHQALIDLQSRLAVP